MFFCIANRSPTLVRTPYPGLEYPSAQSPRTRLERCYHGCYQNNWYSLLLSLLAALAALGPLLHLSRGEYRGRAASPGCLSPVVQNLAFTCPAGSAGVQVTKHPHPREDETRAAGRALHLRSERVKQHDLTLPSRTSRHWLLPHFFAVILARAKTMTTGVLGARFLRLSPQMSLEYPTPTQDRNILAHIAPGGLGLVLCPERNIIRIFIVRGTMPPADCPTLTVSREYCCALAPLCARLSGQKPRQARTTSIGERTDRGVRHRYTSTSVSWLPAIPATG
jgi:hypothetical protein